jgi:hypothetical protein
MKIFIFIASFIALCSARSDGRLEKGECVFRNDPIISAKNCFRLVVQDDGNMVIYRQWDGKWVWDTRTAGKGGYKVCMQRNFFKTNRKI